jgi:hypothetical protein
MAVIKALDATTLDSPATRNDLTGGNEIMFDIGYVHSRMAGIRGMEAAQFLAAASRRRWITGEKLNFPGWPVSKSRKSTVAVVHHKCDVFSSTNQTNKKTKIMTRNKFIKIMVGAVMATGLLMQARADETQVKQVDPTGTYIWVMPGRNGGPDRTNTLVLKLDGDKLTGKLLSPRRNGQTNITDIVEGKVTGAEVSFSVVRTYNDNTTTNKYTGTLGDTSIKGKIEFIRDGETQSRDWEAKSVKQ